MFEDKHEDMTNVYNTYMWLNEMYFYYIKMIRNKTQNKGKKKKKVVTT